MIYTMTKAEALAAVPPDAMNPTKLAALLREVTSVAQEERDRAIALLWMEHHLALLKREAAARAPRCCPEGN